MRRVTKNVLLPASAIGLLFPGTASAEPAGGTRLTLDHAMELADETNPDLAVAAEKVGQSRADVRAAYAAFLPRVQVGGSYLWYDEEVTLPIPAALGGAVTLQEKAAYAAQVQGTWPLVNPAALPALSAAKHGHAAAAAAYAAGRQELFAAVAQAFWAIAAADRLVEASEEAVANATEQVRVAEAQVKAEVATDLARLRARTAEEQAKQALISARGARGVAEAALRRLTGVEGPIHVEVPSSSRGTLEDADEEALWREAERGRPDLLAAREALAARRSLGRASRLAVLPLLAGQGTWYYTSNEGLAGKSDGYHGGLVASWTILDGGLREARSSRARSEEREALAARESAERKAREEVSRTFLGLATARAALEAAREAARLASEARDLAQAAYAAGVATNLEVTQANATLLQARAALATAEAQAALAELALRKAIGRPLR